MIVHFEPAAVEPPRRPDLPRSGAAAAPLPAWHADEAIMLGGYTEDAAAPGPAGAPAPPPKRAPTMDAWAFSSADGGAWRRVEWAPGSPVPQPRLTSAAALVGDCVWLVGGWDPSAPDRDAQFLDDVWRLHVREWRWERVAVGGAPVPRISRFAMAPLPGGRLLLHTHRCDDHVLVLHTEAEGGARLERVPLAGGAAGAPSPASRGLHSLTPAAAPPAAGAAGGGGGTALYLYGGAPQSGPMYGDLWALDPGAPAWRQLEPAGPAPHARCSHVAGAVGGGRYLLLAGGSYYAEPGRLQPLDDVWLYDTQENRWLEAGVSGQRPSARNASVLVPLRPSPDGGEGRFVLHGGWRPFVQTYPDTFIVTVRQA